MEFKLPTLNYDYTALEPHIDAKTMEIHHTKHHDTYVSKLNAAYEGSDSLENIMRNISKFPVGIRNNGGGHFNHSLFWTVLSASSSENDISQALNSAITSAFGSLESMKKEFAAAAVNRFGSGWAWLCFGKDTKTLCVCSSANQDNPLMDIAECPGIPILGLDVWEHAYYLNYQNRRPDYIAAFWNVVNWKEVSARYNNALAEK